MVLQQSPCPVLTDPTELQRQTQNTTSEHQLQNPPTARTEQLLDPKATTENSPLVWEELLCETTVETTAGTAPSSGIFMVHMNDDDYNQMKSEKETGIVDLLSSFQTVSGTFESSTIIKQTIKSSLDGEDTSKKQPEDNETSSTECDVQPHEYMKQKVGKAFPWAGEEHVSEHAQLEFYNRRYTFLGTCSRITNIAGITSKSPENDGKLWPKEQTVIWRKELQLNDMLPKNAPEDLNHRNQNEMALLTPSCPKEAMSPGFPSLSPKGLFFDGAVRLNIFQFFTNLQETSVSDITKEDEPFTPQQEVLLAKTIETELCVMAGSVKEENPIKLRTAATQSFSNDSDNPGVMSVLQPTVGYHGSDNIAILGSYQKTSPIEGIPSLVQNNFTQNWATSYEPIIIQKPKRNTVIENPLCDYEVRIMTLLAPTCPKQASTSGFPSALTPTLIYNGSSSINALPSCPAVSTIIGFPSIQKADSKDWKPNHQPLWGKVLKQIVFLLQKYEMQEDAKEGVFLAPTCPWQSLIPGFPSFPKASKINVSMKSMVSLSSSCSEVSQIAGFPSFHSPKWWTASKKPLFEPRVTDKHQLLNDQYNRGKTSMKGIVSSVPSCPKVSSIKGFPTIPHPKIEYYRPNIVDLLPLCPIFSATPGLSSLEWQKGEGWTSDQSSLMCRPQKIIQCSVDFSPVYSDKPKNMILLTSTCPRESVILGCPSVGQFKMPAVRSEHSLFEGAPKFQLPSKPLVSNKETSKTTVSLTETLDQDDKTTNNMNASEPPFLEPSRIHRASCSSKHKSTLEPDMFSFVPCCSSASHINGFASFTAVPSTEWLTDTKAVYVRTQVRHSILMALSGPKQLDYFNRKCMVTSLISCPKQTRVYGLAQKSNRSLDMISSYTSVPFTSYIPGFTSARRNSSECAQEQTWPTNKILFEKQQKENIFIANFPSKPYLNQPEKKSMVAMVSSCPHLSQIPGFPSYLQSKKLQPVCNPLSVSAERHALQELPHTQSDLKDASVRGIPSFCVRSQHTELTCGESFQVFSANIQNNTLFSCLFVFIYFHMFAL